jgi:hypothetical protein
MKVSELRTALELVNDRTTAREIIIGLTAGELLNVTTDSASFMLKLDAADSTAMRAVLNGSILRIEADLAALGVTEFDTDDDDEREEEAA